MRLPKAMATIPPSLGDAGCVNLVILGLHLLGTSIAYAVPCLMIRSMN
jgi:hypothetical protein